jgi:signal transduction histidine kinase
MRSDYIYESLGRRYLTTLALVMVLVLGNQLLVQPYLIRLTTDAPLINIAGRQRMLSQRLAKAVLLLDQGHRERANAALEEIEHVLGLWSKSHQQLVEDNTRNSTAVRDDLAALQPHFVAMRDAAQRMISSNPGHPPDATMVQEGLATVLDHEAQYLEGMDRVVGLYEREARGRIDTFRRIGWLLSSSTLAALLAIGLLIFRPAARLIRSQVAELAQRRDELEERVRERTSELEAARERHRTLLEQFSHVGRTSAIGEMASALAHELKQPLGAIANYAEGCLIALDAPKPALDEVRQILKRLLEATMRAGQIIERVRRFVTRQGPNREWFEANHVVNETVEILGIKANRRGVAVSLELAPGLPYLWGDPVQIQQVLVNLVRNAVESLAQSQTSEPTLVISTRMVGQESVEFAVSDNGEGIPPDRVDRIFDAYFSTRAGGMGMGLTISRTIVEAHQGRLFVESVPGVKTTFRFQLPATLPDDERANSSHRGR